MKLLLLGLSFSWMTTVWATNYPTEWWEPFPRDQAEDWEILPQDAGAGEVILSKRRSLGVFSNLANIPFRYDGVDYQSIESLWQMMKYPDPSLGNDPRLKIEGWPYARKEVISLHGWEAKKAGKKANQLLKDHRINWVSYQQHKFDYKDNSAGSNYHLRIVKGAMRAKISQNPALKALLLQTTGLTLKPDHHIRSEAPAAYHYHLILMEIRQEIIESLE